MLPAARFHNARFAPKSGRAVEIKKASAAAPRDLLEEEMTVEKHRLHTGEERVAAVDVPPAGLDHADPGISEKMDARFKESGLRNKIGVENTDELAPRRRQPCLERAGFVADAILPMDQFDIEPAFRQPPHAQSREGARRGGGVVQHRKGQKLLRGSERAD